MVRFYIEKGVYLLEFLNCHLIKGTCCFLSFIVTLGSGIYDSVYFIFFLMIDAILRRKTPTDILIAMRMSEKATVLKNNGLLPIDFIKKFC